MQPQRQIIPIQMHLDQENGCELITFYPMRKTIANLPGKGVYYCWDGLWFSFRETKQPYHGKLPNSLLHPAWRGDLPYIHLIKRSANQEFPPDVSVSSIFKTSKTIDTFVIDTHSVRYAIAWSKEWSDWFQGLDSDVQSQFSKLMEDGVYPISACMMLGLSWPHEIWKRYFYGEN